MVTITTAQLAFMRARIEDLLPDTCHILSLTNTPDGQGGNTQTWGTATASVKCRIDPGRKMFVDAITGAALQPYDYWVLTLPYNATLASENRVQIGTDVYSVEPVDDGKSWQGSVRANLRKV